MRLRSGRVLVATVFVSSVTLHTIAGCSSFSAGDDAANEAGSVDGSSLDRATPQVDAADAADAATTFCTNIDAAFCADFEYGALDDGWTDAIPATNGVLALADGGAPASPRHALSATAPTIPTDGGLSQAGLEKTLDITATTATISLDFDARVDTVPDAGSGIASVAAITANDGDTVRLSLADGSGAIALDGVGEDAFGTPNKGTWFHIEIVVDLGKDNVQVAVDHGQAATYSFTPGTNERPTSFTVLTGIVALTSGGTNAVSIDNVVIGVN